MRSKGASFTPSAAKTDSVSKGSSPGLITTDAATPSSAMTDLEKAKEKVNLTVRSTLPSPIRSVMARKGSNRYHKKAKRSRNSTHASRGSTLSEQTQSLWKKHKPVANVSLNTKQKTDSIPTKLFDARWKTPKPTAETTESNYFCPKKHAFLRFLKAEQKLKCKSKRNESQNSTCEEEEIEVAVGMRKLERTLPVETVRNL
jgi:hypothetical protein